MTNPLRLSIGSLALVVTALPASAQWSEFTMPLPQSKMASARVGPYLMFAGGVGSLVQVYDTSTGTWVPSQPLSLGRQGPSAATVGSRAVFSGGGVPGSPQDVVDVYDASVGPPSDPAAWTTLTLPTARFGHAAAAVGDKLICARGLGGALNEIADADIYDFVTQDWKTFPLSAGGSGAAAVTLGSKVLIAGGRSLAGPAAPIVDIYDDSTGTWTTATLSEARGELGATTVGSLAFFAGGRPSWGGSEYSSAVDIYDDATGTWTTASLSRARSDVAVAAVGGRVLFAGGDIIAPPGTVGEVEIYDTGTGTWSTSRLASHRASGKPLVAGDSIYFAGGFEGSSSNHSDRVEVYTAPDVLISVAGGGPDHLDRHGTSVPVGIVERVPGSLVPGSETLHYDLGAGPVQVPLVAGGPTGFLAEFPPFDCGAEVSWYVSAASTGGTTYTFPERAPTDVIVSLATDAVPYVVYRMDADDGWTVGDPSDTAVDGLWERGDPVATETQPEFDHTPGPGGECWVTGIGVPLEEADDDDVDGGSTTLFTPVLDLTGVPDPRLSYWRWIYGTSVNDDLLVQITDDGVDWILVERIFGNEPQAKGGWFRSDVRLLDVPGLELTDSIQVRFVARDLLTDNRFEVVLDDVIVTGCSDGPGTIFCRGDGTGASCPCGNDGGPGQGCANGTGSGATLGGSGSDSVTTDDLVLMASNALPSQPGLFFQGDDALDGGAGIPFGDGLRCAGTNVIRLETVVPDGSGAAATSIDVAATGSVGAGQTRYYQYWYRDPLSSPCGFQFNLTNGYAVTWTP